MASIQQLWQGSRTLCCLLQGLEGQRVTVEMKTMRWLRGDIHMVNVDLRWQSGFFFNVTMVFFPLLTSLSMTNAVLYLGHGDPHIEPPPEVEQQHYENFFLLGRYIRYVHLPDTVDVEGTILARLEKTRDSRNVYQRKPKRDAAAAEAAGEETNAGKREKREEDDD